MILNNMTKFWSHGHDHLKKFYYVLVPYIYYSIWIGSLGFRMKIFGMTFWNDNNLSS